MKKCILILISLLPSLLSPASYLYGQDTEWGLVSAGGGDNNDVGESVAVGASGNIYTLVVLTENSSIDGIMVPVDGGYDLFLFCYQPSGKLEWSARILAENKGGEAGPMDLVLDQKENIFISGKFNNTIQFDPDGRPVTFVAKTDDFYFAKYNKQGQFQWAKTSDNPEGNEEAYAITLDNDNNIYVAGEFESSLTFPSKDKGPLPFPRADVLINAEKTDDVFIAKYTSEGAFLWARQLASDQRVRCHDLAVNSKNELYAVGETNGSVGSLKVQKNGPGGLENAEISGGLDDDGFILTYSSEGILVRQYFMEEGDVERIYGIAIDQGDNYYISGHFSSDEDRTTSLLDTGEKNAGATDIFVAKYSAAHDLIWAKSDGDYCQDRGQAIALDQYNNVYITGFWFESGACDPSAVRDFYEISNAQAYVSKFDTDGAQLWKRTFGGDTWDGGSSITVDQQNNVYVTGNYRGAATLDNTILPVTGKSSYYLLKVDQKEPEINTIELSTQAGSAAAYLAGGDEVIILGNYFNPTNTSVSIDETVLPDITVDNQQITCTIPPGLERKEYTISVTTFGYTTASDPILIDSYCRSEAYIAEANRIENVNIGTIDNSTDQNCVGYSYFTASTQLVPGEAAVLAVKLGTCEGASGENESKGLKVFIDWNQDYDFQDEGETVVISDVMSPTDLINQSFQVPENATLGKTRMRVAYYPISDISSLNSCYSSENGETEDYQIFVQQDNTTISPSFKKTVINAGNQGARNMDTFDQDKDGTPDLLSTFRDENKVAIIQNSGQTTFNEILVEDDTLLVGQPQSVFVSDVDHDDLPDFLIAAFKANKVVWAEGTARTAFTAYGASTAKSYNFNNDGFEDLLVAAQQGDDYASEMAKDGSVFILFNDKGTLSESNKYTLNIPAVGNPRGALASDVDADGLLDVIYFSKDNNSDASPEKNDQIGWLKNNGDGTFGNHTIIADASQIADPRSISLADIDQDGDPDLVYASPVDGVGYFTNTGAAFAPLQVIDPSKGAFDVVNTDVDGDGKQDIVVAWTGENRLVWYKNQGSAGAISFAKGEEIYSNPASNPRFTFVHTVDLDGDGDQDIMSADQSKNEVLWLANQIHESPTPILLSTHKSEGVPGDILLLKGAHFGSSIHPNVIEVLFGDLSAQLISVEAGGTLLKVKVPEAPSTQELDVKVTLKKNSTSSATLKFKITITTPPVDITNPLLRFETDVINRGIALKNPFGISVFAGDNESNIKSLEIEYAGITEAFTNSFTPVPNPDLNESIYSWSAPAGAGDELGIKYQIKVINSQDLDSVISGRTYWSYDEKVAILKVPMDSAPKISNYRIVTFPFKEQTVGDVFNNVAYDSLSWRLYRANSSKKYEELNTTTARLVPGEGYWLIAKSDVLDNITGDVAEPDQDGNIVISLHKGWNLIGNPYPFAIDWNAVKEANQTIEFMDEARLSKYKGGGQNEYNKDENKLLAYEGAFVDSPGEAKLIVPFTARATNVARQNLGQEKKKETIASLDVPNWQIDLSVLVSKDIRQSLRLGMHQAAKIEKDFYDADVLPSFFGASAAHFKREGSSLEADIIPQAAFAEWSVELSAKSIHKQVIIHWDNQKWTNHQYALWLFDQQTQQVIDMQATQSYQFQPSDAGHQLKVLYGTRETLLQHVLPSTLHIGKAFPNPATDHINLTMMVPETGAGPVTWQLLDMTGRMIQNGRLSLAHGIHQVSLQVARQPGVYMLKVISTDDLLLNHQKVIIR